MQTINISPTTRLFNAIDSMLWNMYAYRSKPPTPEELAEYDRIYKPYIDSLIEEVKNEDKTWFRKQQQFKQLYIVAVTAECTDRDAAQDIAEKVFGDDFEEVKDFFENKTVLTAVEVAYSDWYAKTQTLLSNFVPSGICVNDDDLTWKH